mmetsp:Transcript_50504/g.125808  ORF Transcript_50504/g.125808 Transcript_50504/m.125808 type:complete len:221 (-) Transcript_50504:318-980(-)|eukprot:CAMPEP_0173437002 /NCGR_PEP_ID=MMETSP1357-20121228/17795_1 /TAXON_ID=77926 /ORGANISM="Hemiselmis rufescens, Strain PCC563" /LENGTH=220 /DNA_ID=CAMNT_0014402157 /DNA_START=117 /DNA_END=779 /DNA_ORIENTATION=-
MVSHFRYGAAALVVVSALVGQAAAFTAGSLHVALRPAPAATAMCLSSPQQKIALDRRGLGAFATGLALAGVLPAEASAAKKERSSAGKWAEHEGPFQPDDLEGFTKTESGLQYKIVQEGKENGVKPKAYSKVKAHYAGYLLANGKKFDASYDRGKPFGFTAGAGGVIKGWDEAVLDMVVGERRILIIPPELAYGNRNVGNGLIPAKSTLVFYIELVTLAT